MKIWNPKLTKQIQIWRNILKILSCFDFPLRGGVYNPLQILSQIQPEMSTLPLLGTPQYSSSWSNTNTNIYSNELCLMFGSRNFKCRREGRLSLDILILKLGYFDFWYFDFNILIFWFLIFWFGYFDFKMSKCREGEGGLSLDIVSFTIGAIAAPYLTKG